MDEVMSAIRQEMEERCSQLGLGGKVLEAERLRQRTENDLLLLDAVGTCKVRANVRLFAAGCPSYSRGEARSRFYWGLSFFVVVLAEVAPRLDHKLVSSPANVHNCTQRARR